MAAKKRRTLTEALSQTKALRGVRNQAALRNMAARAQKLAPVAPNVAVLAYSAAMHKYAARVEKLVEKHVLSRLPVLGSGDPLDRVQLELGLAALEIDLVVLAPSLTRNARAAARRTAQVAERDAMRLLNLKAFEPARRKFLVDDFVARNVQLLRGVGLDQVKRIKKAIADHQEGDSLRGGIKQALWVSRNRGQLIATDQPHKFAAEILRSWSASVGSEGYIWVTRGDESVRKSHRPRHGQFFLWAQPPPGGHPGSEANCRCVAVPVEAFEG